MKKILQYVSSLITDTINDDCYVTKLKWKFEETSTSSWQIFLYSQYVTSSF